ncbi:STAS domain-containing protein [Streptomyces collinus]|uniref:STAS domain-containing protein n=1 Tax=Streptomyces collinus TaxID=42684 RepID=UPI002943AB8A|nr:STAS domain-containing protein [Streptomyces collinus]
MNITTLDGTTARITVRGDIDFDTLPPLRAAAEALPARVTGLLWDLNRTFFMDIAGLHLLFAPATPPDRPDRRITVTGLRPQPLRLLRLAAETNPAAFPLDRLLCDTPATCECAERA